MAQKTLNEKLFKRTGRRTKGVPKKFFQNLSIGFYRHPKNFQIALVAKLVNLLEPDRFIASGNCQFYGQPNNRLWFDCWDN